MLTEKSNRIAKAALNICTSCICLYPAAVVQCPACGRFSKTKPYRKYRRGIFFSLLFLGILFLFISPPASLIILCVFAVNSLFSAKDYRSALCNGGYYFSSKALRVRSREEGTVSGVSVKEPSTPLRDTSDAQEYMSNDSLDDFENQLAVVWAGEDIDIEFSYRRPNGETTRRKVLLSEVLVNDDMEPYLKAFCYTAMDTRIFKYKRVTSKILYEGVKYHKDEFIDEILCLPREDFYY